MVVGGCWAAWLDTDLPRPGYLFGLLILRFFLRLPLQKDQLLFMVAVFSEFHYYYCISLFNRRWIISIDRPLLASEIQ